MVNDREKSAREATAGIAARHHADGRIACDAADRPIGKVGAAEEHRGETATARERAERTIPPERWMG